MEPVDPHAARPPLPPPAPVGTVAEGERIEFDDPGAAHVEDRADVAHRSWRAAAAPGEVIRPQLPMLPWRIAGAIALSATFLLIGWQVELLVDDQPWSDGVMWA